MIKIFKQRFINIIIPPINHPNPNPDLAIAPLALQIPEDPFAQILKYLPTRSIGAAASTCGQWYWTIQADSVWQTLFRSHFPDVVKPNTDGDFQRAYKTLESNLKNVVCAPPYTFEGHRRTISSCVIVDGKLLFSASYDATIRVWDIKTGECLAILEGHENKITSLIAADKHLLSTSTDAIKVWDIKTRECIATLKGPKNKPIAVADGKLFSRSQDGTAIEIWDITTDQCRGTLRYHDNDVIYSFAVVEEKLFLGSAKGIIKVWDIKTGQCPNTFQGDQGPIYSLFVAEGKLFSASAIAIKIWDIQTGQCLNTLHTCLIHPFFAATQGKLFSSAGYTNLIRVWDIETGKQIKTLKHNHSPVVAFAAAYKRLFSAHANGIIEVWDVETDEHLATLQGGTSDFTHLEWYAHNVTPLIFAHGKLFSYSYSPRHDTLPCNNYIKMWDFTAQKKSLPQLVT